MGDQPWPKTTFYVFTTDIAASLEEAGKLGEGRSCPGRSCPEEPPWPSWPIPRGKRGRSPAGGLLLGKVWTLAAWCELREDFRTFRLDRMDRIEAGEPFEEESGRSLRDYLRNIGPGAERLLD